MLRQINVNLMQYHPVIKLIKALCVTKKKRSVHAVRLRKVVRIFYSSSLTKSNWKIQLVERGSSSLWFRLNYRITNYNVSFISFFMYFFAKKLYIPAGKVFYWSKRPKFHFKEFVVSASEKFIVIQGVIQNYHFHPIFLKM